MEMREIPEATAPPAPTPPRMEVRDLNLWYGQKQALFDVNFDLNRSEILAFIGPSGCGKTTALKVLNRMHDATPDVRLSGSVLMEGEDINAREIDPPVLRRRFGWVAQKPNPFAMSIYENVAYGARLHGIAHNRSEADTLVEACLKRAMLWDEVKDDLHRKSGLDLSGGQQQRLCVARALSTDPDVLLMDEPTGSIDPIATAVTEELMMDLGTSHSVVVVTHSMMQARRIADRVAYFHMGRLLEIGEKHEIFNAPREEETRRFIEGAVG